MLTTNLLKSEYSVLIKYLVKMLWFDKFDLKKKQKKHFGTF